MRYKLVDENHLKDLPPEASQTSEITSYYVNYEREDGDEINIRIVDTPGLGDTGGVGKDNEIIQKFEKFFQTTTEIDYILVTVKQLLQDGLKIVNMFMIEFKKFLGKMLKIDLY